MQWDIHISFHFHAEQHFHIRECTIPMYLNVQPNPVVQGALKGNHHLFDLLIWWLSSCCIHAREDVDADVCDTCNGCILDTLHSCDIHHACSGGGGWRGREDGEGKGPLKWKDALWQWSK